MRIHPTTYVCYLCLIISILLNIGFYQTHKKLRYQIQKLECGPWESIFKKAPKEITPPKNNPYIYNT